jgi:FAD/FMN-containing dehydrogenase
LAANTNDGVLIDVFDLTRVIEYDASKQVVRIGAGLRWGEVYSELDQYAVTVVGPRVMGVGVGGSILGGKTPLVLPPVDGD